MVLALNVAVAAPSDVYETRGIISPSDVSLTMKNIGTPSLTRWPLVSYTIAVSWAVEEPSAVRVYAEDVSIMVVGVVLVSITVHSPCALPHVPRINAEPVCRAERMKTNVLPMVSVTPDAGKTSPRLVVKLTV